MAEAPSLGPKGLIDKVEFVRIIAQSLYSLGYPNAAAMLESESGVSIAAPELLLLRSHILAGRWDDCVDALNAIGGLPGDAAFLVLRHAFSELLAAGDEAAAVSTLRRRISGLRVGRGEVHELARELVLSGHGVGGGEVGELRRRLVGEVERLLPPPIRLPERRLEHLVETALAVQRENCFYHNSSDGISLYEDHCCGRDQIPTETVQVGMEILLESFHF